MDVVYFMALAVLCMSLSRAKDLVLPNKSTTIVHLPPNHKIPTELLLSVQRRTHLELPLVTLNSLKLQPPQRAQEKESSFEYPDNSTSLHNEEEDSYHDNEMYYPDDMDDGVWYEGQYHDYGVIHDELRFLTEEGEPRRIYRHQWEREGRPRRLNQPRDDDHEAYWAFDDDWLRNPMVQYDDDTIQEEHRCRRVNWTRKRFPTGTLLHEMDLVNNVPKLVGEGAYREVFVVEQPVLGKMEKFVLKEIRYDNEMHYDAHEYVRVDALVTERMTSNPQIVNMYGFTGFSILAEVFVNGDIEEDVVGFDDRIRSFNPYADPELRTWNNFTGTQKLKLALSMVEPVEACKSSGLIILFAVSFDAGNPLTQPPFALKH